MTVDEILKRILDLWLSLDEDANGQRDMDSDQIAVYAIYQCTRVEALYNPRTEGITGTTAPSEGKQFSSSSGAARAVVEALNPQVNSNRSGPRFWRIAATGKELASILR